MEFKIGDTVRLRKEWRSRHYEIRDFSMDDKKAWLDASLMLPLEDLELVQNDNWS